MSGSIQQNLLSASPAVPVELDERGILSLPMSAYVAGARIPGPALAGGGLHFYPELLAVVITPAVLLVNVDVAFQQRGFWPQYVMHEFFGEPAASGYQYSLNVPASPARMLFALQHFKLTCPSYRYTIVCGARTMRAVNPFDIRVVDDAALYLDGVIFNITGIIYPGVYIQ